MRTRASLAIAGAVVAALAVGGVVTASSQSTTVTADQARAAIAQLQAYVDQPVPTVTETVTVTATPAPASSSPAPATSSAAPTPTPTTSSPTPTPSPTGAIGGNLGIYTPPQLTNPVTIRIAASGGTYSAPATTDCIFVAPAVITGPVTLAGCDDRWFIGGIFGGRTTVPSGSYDSTNRGIRLSDSGSSNTGRDFLEGLWFKPGTYLSDAIQIAFRSTTGRTVTLQNIRVESTTYGSKAGVHADALQVWGGPKQLRVWGWVSLDGRYQGWYLDDSDGRTPPATGPGWEVGNVFIRLTGPDASYALTQREAARVGTRNLGPVYTLGSKYSANSNPSYSAWPMSNLFEGQTPPVDFVPASLWASGNYVSPWS
ncbi:MAG: hypothetical protein AB7G36_18585 [Candidatus Nanopelagicales bacterium]